MSKDPAILFYSSDFLTGTMTMSNEHVGMYIRLLCLQHQKGRLTEKDLAYICGSHVEDVYDKFEKDENNLFYNKRLEGESVRRSNFCESRRLSRMAGVKKKSRTSNVRRTHVRRMETATATETTNINTNEKELVVFS